MITNDTISSLAKQFRNQASQCIPNGEGMQAFNYCAEALEIIIPKHSWIFFMNGTFCSKCGCSLGEGDRRDCQ